MKYLIIEDEINACEYIRDLLKRLRPEGIMMDHLDSVEESINWLNNTKEQPDLIFMDIQLSDGLSFEIFDHVDVTCPIIFTTAYDQFAIQAFKVNGLDYLLKPISPEDMESALEKFDNQNTKSSNSNFDQLSALVSAMNTQKKNRFLIKKGNHFEFIEVNDIAFVHSEDSLTFLFTKDGKRHMYSKTISEIETALDPKLFFRINRGQMVHVDAIAKIHPYFNQRLKVELSAKTEIEFIVSRNKMMEFKGWVDS